jgi:CheY-like chemotaxis protein
MNDEFPTFTIGLIGFERSERRVLRRLVSVSEYRRPTYRPFDKYRGGCPHLVIVNADGPRALENWGRFRRANALRARFSPIFVSHKPTDLPCPGAYVLYRPILTTRLFSMLDQAVAEVHSYRPTPTVEPVDDLVALTEFRTPPGPMAVADVRRTTRCKGESGRRRALAEVTALVVDDSFPARVQMRGALSSIASRVDFAETGVGALQLIDRHAYSVVFLDMMLPDENAYEICDRIKRHPLQQQAAVIMLTNSSSPADRVMGTLAGFDNYLVKPIQRAVFNQLALGMMRPLSAI